MRGYSLASTWRLPAPVERCWGVLADPTFTWPLWWPGVVARRVAPAPDGLVGSVATMVFRSPLRYVLVLELRVVDAYPPHHVVMSADGDLVGHATARLTALAADRTRLDIQSDVVPTRRWMLWTGPLMAPLFRAVHAAMMRDGERGLARYLTVTA